MKSVLIALLIGTAAPAFAGGTYPEEARNMVDLMAQWHGYAVVCKDFENWKDPKSWTKKVIDEMPYMWRDMEKVARNNGYDWDRIKQNVLSRKIKITEKDCKTVRNH